MEVIQRVDHVRARGRLSSQVRRQAGLRGGAATPRRRVGGGRLATAPRGERGARRARGGRPADRASGRCRRLENGRIELRAEAGSQASRKVRRGFLAQRSRPVGAFLARARRGRHQAHVTGLPLVRLPRVCALWSSGHGDVRGGGVVHDQGVLRRRRRDGRAHRRLAPRSPRRSSGPSRSTAAKS